MHPGDSRRTRQALTLQEFVDEGLHAVPCAQIGQALGQPRLWKERLVCIQSGNLQE